MDNFEIRIARPEDAEALLKIYRPYVERTAVSFECAVPSVEEFRGRIERTLEKYPYLLAEHDGEILGYAYAGVFKAREAYSHSVETSIYVRSGLNRQGIGRALYTALENELRRQGILNMYACIASPEAEDAYLGQDSTVFHEKLGFQPVGRFYYCGFKFGRWYSMVWMEKLIGPHTENPAPVLPFPQARDI